MCSRRLPPRALRRHIIEWIRCEAFRTACTAQYCWFKPKPLEHSPLVQGYFKLRHGSRGILRLQDKDHEEDRRRSDKPKSARKSAERRTADTGRETQPQEHSAAHEGNCSQLPRQIYTHKDYSARLIWQDAPKSEPRARTGCGATGTLTGATGLAADAAASRSLRSWLMRVDGATLLPGCSAPLSSVYVCSPQAEHKQTTRDMISKPCAELWRLSEVKSTYSVCAQQIGSPAAGKRSDVHDTRNDGSIERNAGLARRRARV